MGLSALVLGLMPTVFSLIGSTTIEIRLLSLRRPVLASLIGAASPMVNPLYAAEYRNPLYPLRLEAVDTLKPSVLGHGKVLSWSLSTYLLVCRCPT